MQIIIEPCLAYSKILRISIKNIFITYPGWFSGWFYKNISISKIKKLKYTWSITNKLYSPLFLCFCHFWQKQKKHCFTFILGLFLNALKNSWQSGTLPKCFSMYLKSKVEISTTSPQPFPHLNNTKLIILMVTFILG